MTAMSTLALQLLLYGLTWFALGWVFDLRRTVGYWWAAAFSLMAAGTWAVSLQLGAQDELSVLTVNITLIGGFYCLMRGMAVMGGYTLSRLDQSLPLVFLIAVMSARAIAPEAHAIRLAFFFLATFGCIVRSGVLLHRLMHAVGFGRLFVPLGLIPVMAILGLLLVRPVALAMGASDPQTYLLAIQSDYQDLVILVSFVSLALFNLAMAVVVIGGLIDNLRRHSNTDALTHLPNRRSVIATLEQGYEAYRRGGAGFSVLMIDIDHFKRINDTHGHAVGDEVLVSVSQCMRQTVRTADVLARFGGEEFLAYLPNTTEDEAQALAERLLVAISTDTHTTPPLNLRVTASLGISAVSPSDANLDEVIARADKALYEAKHMGRNRVVRATEQTETLWAESWVNED